MSRGLGDVYKRQSQVETLALIAARMEAAGIPYTVETEGVEQEDWQNGWRKYYHPMEIGPPRSLPDVVILLIATM